MFQQEILDNIVEKGIQSLDFQKKPDNLYAPVEYVFSIGGKHLRPRLCITAYNLFSDNIPQEVVHCAMALEIFHEFTLLHDDIMDKSDTRRGRPTVHVKWNDNIAILSGDMMSIMAYQHLAHCPQQHLPKALKLFSDTATGVCEGQQKDMDFENMPFITMDDYLDMIGQKTGVLLACSAAMGALLAGAPDAQVNALYNYGYNLGIAFQIADDYLDTFGDPKVFGKPIGGDIANNKKSWLLVEAMHRAVSEERKGRLKAICGMPEARREEKIAAMTALYVEFGIGEDARKAISEYSDKAIEALVKGGLNREQIDRMKEISDKLVQREK